MSVIKQYLSKQRNKQRLITDHPSDDLQLIVVIPAYKEANIMTTLQSLLQCHQADCSVEILVFINGSANDDITTHSINQDCYQQCLKAIDLFEDERRKLHVIVNLDMPSKRAGVGLARKTLMDEAAARFDLCGNIKGVIINLDADCLLDTNYFVETKKWFDNSSKLDAASIHYEHLIDSPHIINYELHLRYFIGMQKVIGLPFAYQTVGSAMACRADAYAKVGGMNSRRAGEDFYFLHKFIKNDNCGKITSTTIYPSGRLSDRVPFGTGRAVGEMMQGNKLTTYNYQSFIALEHFLQDLNKLYSRQKIQVNKHLQAYLDAIGFEDRLNEIISNTSNFKAFRKRFFQFFDAFQLMKCLHYIRDSGLNDITLDEALPQYLAKINVDYKGVNEDTLVNLRQFDRTDKQL